MRLVDADLSVESSIDDRTSRTESLQARSENLMLYEVPDILNLPHINLLFNSLIIFTHSSNFSDSSHNSLNSDSDKIFPTAF